MLTISTDNAYQLLLDSFAHEPTAEQAQALHLIARFLTSSKSKGVFILKGSAGTGKTTLMKTVTRVLDDEAVNCILLAPTGRAAKVIASKTRRGASTIHKHIYDASTTQDGRLNLKRKTNNDPSPTVYIVDEASMLSSSTDSKFALPGASLLNDLIRYVFDDDDQNKLILLGDPIQLPPVNQTDSLALQRNYIIQNFSVLAAEVMLTDVKRQALQSGILLNANNLRKAYREENLTKLPDFQLCEDVIEVTDYNSLIDFYIDLYDPEEPDNVVIITHSNNTAVKLNMAIRSRLHPEMEDPVAGDLVMVVKNHYSKRYDDMPFIANGEMARIAHVDYNSLEEEKFGHKWLNISLEIADSIHNFDTKIPVNLMSSAQPSLTSAEGEQIWQQVKADRISNKLPVSLEEMRNDEYISAMQLKYGYAITAHKAQGGQWKNVMVVFEPYLFKNKDNELKELIRWSYTAITRAEECLFVYNSPFPLV